MLYNDSPVGTQYCEHVSVVTIIDMCCNRTYLRLICIILQCVFPQKMDKNKDGVVTLEEFIIACQEVCILLHLKYLK